MLRRAFSSTFLLLPLAVSIASVAACGGSSGDSTGGSRHGTASAAGDDAGTGATGATGDDATSGGSCVACVTDNDCAGGSCVQTGGDSYCGAPCDSAGACGGGLACAVVSSVAGAQVSVCLPTTGACAPSGGGGTDAGTTTTTPPPSDAGTTTMPPPPSDAGASMMCGSLVGPDVPASCKCGSTTSKCTANGCYGGWWCNTSTNRCQSPPSGCSTAPTDAGTGGGDGGATTPPPPTDGGTVSGTLGANGGTLSSLLFAVVGDTRPATIDDTSAYPSAIIKQIYADISARSPMPPFVVSTGDYMFATASGSQASPQADLYLAARATYSGMWYPAMGNHECTGATASNCGPGGSSGTTNNYSVFLSKLLGPIAKTTPYYTININAPDGSWTSKFVFIAANAWDSTQSSWLDAELAKSTTYTFIVRHEPAAANTAPGVTPSEAIMAKHPYTLSIVGHTHTYEHPSTREVLMGNGGAPLTGSKNYGYGLFTQRADGAIQVEMIDYSTGASDSSFKFAVKADGTATP